MFSGHGIRIPNLLSDVRGATAIEVAMIAPVFLVVICAWVEVGLCLLMSAALDNATRDASRLIRIGTATETTFKAALCKKVAAMIPCTGIVYKVQTATTFSALSVVAETSSGTFASTGYAAGGSGADMLVQVGYGKPAFFGSLLKAVGLNGKFLISSTIAFQNETF